MATLSHFSDVLEVELKAHIQKTAPEKTNIAAKCDIKIFKDSGSYTWKVVSHGHNWLKCVSKRSGMPVWVVFATLLLSSVFLLWLCCASTDTAPKHREKELLLDDLLFLDEPLHLKKKPLIKCDENEDAEPLPMKVNIDATLI